MALVTGVAGFIGSHLAERLVTEGWQVRGVDAFTDAYDPARKRANLRWLQTRCEFELVEADLAADDLGPLVRGSDVVLHLAAEPGVPGSWGPAFA
ncbi:MAG: GDP-mannose 4,6-dehydratase, partial [Actinomycetota bacterium]|nr:GDP-mannose 4,6-dehydratase [Actinomycetota bacterium]